MSESVSLRNVKSRRHSIFSCAFTCIICVCVYVFVCWGGGRRGLSFFWNSVRREINFLGGAGTGMTGPQEDSNEGKLCLPLKMGVVKGRVRMKMRWRVEGVG